MRPPWRGARSIAALAALLAFALVLGARLPAASAKRVTPPAKPAPPPAAADADAQPGFWTRVAHPQQKRYDELTSQGRALFEQEKPGVAVEVLAEAARLDPARPDAWWFLGMAYQRLDRFAECADALGHVLALEPDGWVPAGAHANFPEPAFSLALCDAVAGRLEASVALLEHALAGEGLSLDAIATLTYNLADSYHALGRLEDAIRAYQRAIEVRGNIPLYRFSLAVAFDRDEQGARAREEMITALAADRALASISQPNTLFVPPEDEDYFRGFALEVLAGNEALKSAACQPWMCRSLARAYFRRFLVRAAQSPWRPRVDAHLHDLGDAAPRADEVSVLLWTGHGEDASALPYLKTVMAVAPRLQACVADNPLMLLRADVFLPGKSTPAAKPAPVPAGKKRAPPEPAAMKPGGGEKTFSVQNAGPGPADDAARACVAAALSSARWPAPAAGPVRVQLAVSPP